MSNFQTFIFCFFFVPILGISYLNRPIHNHVMKKYVVSRRYASHVRYHYKMIKSYLIIIVLSSLIIEMVYLLNYFFMLRKFKEKYPDLMREIGESVALNDMNSLLWGEIYHLMDSHGYWETNVASNQVFISFYVFVITIILVLGFEHERYTVYVRRYMIWRNKALILSIFGMSLFYLTYFSAYFIIIASIQNSKHFYFPNYILWIILIIHGTLIAASDQVTKKIVRNQYNRDQTRLKLFYEIKLGMYSPK